MGLSDIAGVFSRYFIVGFFLPAFFALIALSQSVDVALLPTVYVHASSGAQIAIAGGAALALGLVLLGLHYQVLRLYEGYPLAQRRSWIGIKQLYNLMMSRQQQRFRDAVRSCGSPTNQTNDQFDASWRLDRHFPHDPKMPTDDTLLLPTSLGNAIRSFERHSFIRWHLNSIAVWPYIENLLSDHESEVLSDVRGDVAFFINTSLVASLSGAVLLFDMLAYASAPSGFVLLIPLGIAVVAYKAAVGSAVNWGEVVRASIDTHRLEVYTNLGLRRPRNLKDERQMAWRLNAMLLIGDRMPEEFAAEPDETSSTKQETPTHELGSTTVTDADATPAGT
jgi:hypothetical protein